MSINITLSYAQVNDSIANALFDRYVNWYQNKSSTEYHNSFAELNDSLYLNVVKNLCDSFQNRSAEKDTLFVLFDEIVFKNCLHVENELNKMQVSDKFPDRNATVCTINQAFVEGDFCFLSVAIHSLNHDKKQLITSGFIYFIYKKKEGKYILDKKIESSF